MDSDDHHSVTAFFPVPEPCSLTCGSATCTYPLVTVIQVASHVIHVAYEKRYLVGFMTLQCETATQVCDDYSHAGMLSSLHENSLSAGANP